MAPGFDDQQCGTAVAFQEKVAWLTLAAIAVAQGAFFTALANVPAQDAMIVQVMGMFAVALVAQSLIVSIGRSFFVTRDPKEAKAPLDERDRAVAHRATSIAYYVLMAEVVVLSLALTWLAVGWHISVALLAALVVADVVRNLALIVNYRRHG